MATMFQLSGAFHSGSPLLKDDPFFPQLEAPELWASMTANEETSGDSVSFQPQYAVQSSYGADGLDDNYYGDQPDSSMEDTSAVASGASYFSGDTEMTPHLPSHQSVFRSADRHGDVAASQTSFSPGTEPAIMTPLSGNTWRPSDGSESDDLRSPASSGIMSNDYEFVPRFQTIQSDHRNQRQGVRSTRVPPPLPPAAASGASELNHGSPASSIITSRTSNQDGMSPWTNVNAGSDFDTFQMPLDNTYGAWTVDSFDSTAETGPQYLDHELQQFEDQSNTAVLLIRTSSDGPVLSQTSFDASYIPNQDHTPIQHYYIAPETPRFESHRTNRHYAPATHGALHGYTTNVPSAFAATPMAPTAGPSSGHKTPTRRGPLRHQNQTTYRNTPTVPSQPQTMPGFLLQYSQMPPPFTRDLTNHATPTSRPLPTLAPSQPGPADVVEAPQQSSGKGGRKRGMTLKTATRLQSSAMRKRTACWRCALQRDSCDQGAPCKRCMQKATKGNLTYFGCDRSKLPDLVYDFLPPEASMTIMHQKQSIEDTIKEQVLGWDEESIDVYLSSGYGPPLRWTLYEFKPRTTDLLGQFQYTQNRETGEQVREHKYSPPFGIMKLDSSNDVQVENYLTTLMDQRVLLDLGWTFYEEESQMDPDMFQATLLDQMCRLYIQTQDNELAMVLKNIIRMLILTYIMGHTLTIAEETLPSVINHIKHTPRYPTSSHTSPRLANRQLKLYFAVMRKNIYEGILNWQQQILHASKQKESSWLASFCAVLGFGMVLEEVQRTLFIQMDAKITKSELPHMQAIAEAQNACERIDERYKLLVGLFQCKYRDKRWGSDGSFGPSTPRYSDFAAREFLGNVREMLEEKSDYLKIRRDVTFAREKQCLYTSRLVARFLLPFLELP